MHLYLCDQHQGVRQKEGGRERETEQMTYTLLGCLTQGSVTNERKHGMASLKVYVCVRDRARARHMDREREILPSGNITLCLFLLESLSVFGHSPASKWVNKKFVST